MDSNEARLEERITAVLRKHQADNLEEKIEESINKKFSDDTSRLPRGDKRRVRPPGNTPGSRAEPSWEAFRDAQAQAYWKARRSLRLWPVSGNDLNDAAVDFLTGRH